MICCFYHLFFQAEDGIRARVRSRVLGDGYKGQAEMLSCLALPSHIGPALSHTAEPVPRSDDFCPGFAVKSLALAHSHT